MMLGLMLTLVGLAVAAAAGAVATLAAQWFLFNRWICSQPSAPPEPKPAHEPFHLPEILAEALRSGDVSRPESCVAFNLVLQFLFRELRHSPQVHRWLHKKLSAEFAELLTRTTTGKLFDSVTVREIHLGSQLPVLRSIAVREARIDPAVGHLEELDLSLDVHYSGGFQLAVDANMLLGKAAYLAVTVTHLSGQARLQFQRHPYTHWSFSFYSEPRLELAVESQFQGRPLPQVTSLIISQIRKTLKKKHTLPHYKLRYKPFFHKPGLGEEEDEADGVNRDSPAGSLQVAVLEITRLNYPNPPPAYVYCSLVVDVASGVQRGDLLLAEGGRRLERPCTLDPAPAHGASDTDSGSSSPASAPGSPAKRPSTGGSGSQPSSPEHRLSTDEGDPNDDGLQLQRTQELPRAQVLSFEESLQFEVKPQHRYLNVSVWGQTRDQSSRKATSTASSGSANIAPASGSVSDQLLGHVSLSLAPLLAECQAAGPLSHQLRPCVLLPPDPHTALNHSHPLAGHSGFEPCLCYGDILLAFLFTPVEAGMVPPQAQQQTPKMSRPASPGELSRSTIFTSGNAHPLRRHDFLRTHFNRATQCGFCGKKIWLKDAVQCRDCAMTCHKKCVARCQEAAACSGGEAPAAVRRLSAQPEIVTTAAEEEPPPTPGPQQQGSGGEGVRRGGLGGLLATAAAHARGLRRAGSANNLALPGGGAGAGVTPAAPSPGLPPSRSLPPSPQRSPQPSRKSSLVGPPPFSLAGEEDVEALLERLLAHPNDDDLMAAAKTSGKQLYACLPIAERKMKINNMISKLKSAMDAETHSRLALEGAMDSSGGRGDPAAAARNAFLIGKSDEKVQALAVLMLHFCAGLQHAQDLEDAAKRESADKPNDCDDTEQVSQ